MTTRTKTKPASAPTIPWWDITLKLKGKKQITLPVVAETEAEATEKAKRCLVQGKAFKLDIEEYEEVRDTITVVKVEQLTAVSR